MINFAENGILSSPISGEHAARHSLNEGRRDLFGIYFKAQNSAEQTTDTSHPLTALPSQPPLAPAAGPLQQADIPADIPNNVVGPLAVAPDRDAGLFLESPPAAQPAQGPSVIPTSPAPGPDNSALPAGPARPAGPSGHAHPAQPGEAFARHDIPRLNEAAVPGDHKSPEHQIPAAGRAQGSSPATGENTAGPDTGIRAPRENHIQAENRLPGAGNGTTVSAPAQSALAGSPVPEDISARPDAVNAQQQGQQPHPTQSEGLSRRNPSPDRGRSPTTATQAAPDRGNAEALPRQGLQPGDAPPSVSISPTPLTASVSTKTATTQTSLAETGLQNPGEAIATTQFAGQLEQSEQPSLTALIKTADTDTAPQPKTGHSSTVSISVDGLSSVPATSPATSPAPPTPTAPATASPLPNTTPAPGLERGGALSQIATAVQVSVHTHSNLEIRLDPPDLGRVTIDFSFEKDGSITALLNSDNDDTSSLLRRHSDQLIRELANAGFDDVKLEFGSEFNRQSDQDQDTTSDGPPNAALRDLHRSDDSTAEQPSEEPVSSPFITAAARRGSGPIDIRL